MLAVAADLAGIDQHDALPDGGKIMRDLEFLDRGAVEDDVLQQGMERGNIPLPVSRFEDMAAFGLAAAGAEHLVEDAIGAADRRHKACAGRRRLWQDRSCPEPLS